LVSLASTGSDPSGGRRSAGGASPPRRP